MDSLTHLVAGALTPLAFPNTPKRAAVLGFGIAVGELPDIDVLFGISPEALLVLHRGITHSLVWQPVMVLIAVIPFFIWMQGKAPRRLAAERDTEICPRPGAQNSPGFLTMYFMALFAVFTHIYLDCMTTFGTQILLPFSPARVGLPAMFIVDLLLTIPALILLVRAWRQKADICLVPAGAGLPPAKGSADGFAFVSGKSRHFARIGLAWILLYPLAALGINYTATAYLEKNDQGGKRTLLTEPFSPLLWKSLVDEGDSYSMSTLNLLNPGKDCATERFSKPDAGLYARLKEQLPLFGQFEQFCSFMVQMERSPSPYARAGHGEKVKEYAFVDMRYLMSPDSPALWIGRTDPNFVLEARVNEDGSLLAYRFLQRGKDADSKAWTEM